MCSNSGIQSYDVESTTRYQLNWNRLKTDQYRLVEMLVMIRLNMYIGMIRLVYGGNLFVLGRKDTHGFFSTRKTSMVDTVLSDRLNFALKH